MAEAEVAALPELAVRAQSRGPFTRCYRKLRNATFGKCSIDELAAGFAARATARDAVQRFPFSDVGDARNLNAAIDLRRYGRRAPITAILDGPVRLASGLNGDSLCGGLDGSCA